MNALGASEPCPHCGAPLAGDQRYCLECGERRMPASSVLSGGVPHAGSSPVPPGAEPGPGQAQWAGGDPSHQRGSMLTVIAGVGVLMLAMGVGVLIGRAGSTKAIPAAAQVLTVGSAPSTATTAAAAEPFTSDWPAGSSGFTVQLQTLPQPSTQVSAVEAAKAQASAKGAKGVGALKSEEFAGLRAGSYVIYSGHYRRRAEAERALAGLKRGFPGASVIELSRHGAGSPAGGSSPSGGSGTPNNPAPPTVLESNPKKGQSYEQKSKNLPNVISTG
jgi:hypothetical protein